MPKKSKYNPSGKPVLTKRVAKGAFIKNLDSHGKRLNYLNRRKVT